MRERNAGKAKHSPNNVQLFDADPELLPLIVQRVLDSLGGKQRTALLGEFDSAALSTLVDKGTIQVRPGKDGRAWGIHFAVALSHEGAERTFRTINKTLGLHRKVRPFNPRGTVSVQRRVRLAGEPGKYRGTKYYELDDASEALKLFRAALPHSMRRKRLRGAIRACGEILARQTSQAG